MTTLPPPNDPKRKGPLTKAERPRDVPTIDPDLLAMLDPAEIEEIRVRAHKQAQLETKQLAEKAMFERLLEEERRKLEPDQELVWILLDLPPFAREIRLDGRVFYHGQEYHVPRSVHDTMREIMARGWAHDREVGHPNRDRYVPPPIGTGNYVLKARPQTNSLNPSNAEAMQTPFRVRY